MLDFLLRGEGQTQFCWDLEAKTIGGSANYFTSPSAKRFGQGTASAQKAGGNEGVRLFNYWSQGRPCLEEGAPNFSSFEWHAVCHQKRGDILISPKGQVPSIGGLVAIALS